MQYPIRVNTMLALGSQPREVKESVYTGDVRAAFVQRPVERVYRLGTYTVDYNHALFEWQVMRLLPGERRLGCGGFTTLYDAFIAAELANDTERRCSEGFYR